MYPHASSNFLLPASMVAAVRGVTNSGYSQNARDALTSANSRSRLTNTYSIGPRNLPSGDSDNELFAGTTAFRSISKYLSSTRHYTIHYWETMGFIFIGTVIKEGNIAPPWNGRGIGEYGS